MPDYASSRAVTCWAPNELFPCLWFPHKHCYRCLTCHLGCSFCVWESDEGGCERRGTNTPIAVPSGHSRLWWGGAAGGSLAARLFWLIPSQMQIIFDPELGLIWGFKWMGLSHTPFHLLPTSSLFCSQVQGTSKPSIHFPLLYAFLTLGFCPLLSWWRNVGYSCSSPPLWIAQ